MDDVINVYEPMQPEPVQPAAAAPPRRSRVRFTGTGQEYFRIWIVNLLLTIVTLGIYSAWAKVRKMQYLYRNTRLDGSVFDYHGDPIAILKGRILAVLLAVLYKLSLTLLGLFGLIALAGLLLAVPWLLTQSYRFRLHNSSYRGLRFRFDGPLSHAYLIIGLPMVVVLGPSVVLALSGDPKHPDPKLAIDLGLLYLAFMLLWPYLHFCFKRWQHGHALYGTARASFQARVWEFYAPYLVAGLLLFLALVAGGVLMGAIGFASAGHASDARRLGVVVGILFVILFYSVMLAVAPIVTARIQNAVWDGTRLERLGFASDVRAGRLIGITLTNLVMILVSVGLLIPFAVMRLMKYKVESIEVLDADALGRFVSEGKDAGVGSAGEGAVDVMDLDFGL
ncbi:MAG TPA: YjgN family protein [Burkholderiaceae bacterium]|jgi:uncharacterized membrane protein YjgN (DUF898 family)|nr:YjgN family protein [Burkholderiaceae bacterium]